MLIRRIGSFFILVGAGLLLIFAASLQTRPSEGVVFLLAGLGGIAAGILIYARAPRPPSRTSNRFRLLQRRNGDSGADNEE